ILQTLRALRPKRRGCLRLLLIERLPLDRLGKGGEGTAVVHRGLSALGLELVQDLCELRDLGLVQAQPERQEPERSPDSEGSAAERGLDSLALAVGWGCLAANDVSAACVRATVGSVTSVLPPMHHRWSHRVLLSPGRFAPGGSIPWAPCLTDAL